MGFFKQEETKFQVKRSLISPQNLVVRFTGVDMIMFDPARVKKSENPTVSEDVFDLEVEELGLGKKVSFVWTFVIDEAEDVRLVGQEFVFQTNNVFASSGKSQLPKIVCGITGKSVNREEFYEFEPREYFGNTYRMIVGQDEYEGKLFNTIVKMEPASLQL